MLALFKVHSVTLSYHYYLLAGNLLFPRLASFVSRLCLLNRYQPSLTMDRVKLASFYNWYVTVWMKFFTFIDCCFVGLTSQDFKTATCQASSYLGLVGVCFFRSHEDSFWFSDFFRPEILFCNESLTSRLPVPSTEELHNTPHFYSTISLPTIRFLFFLLSPSLSPPPSLSCG